MPNDIKLHVLGNAQLLNTDGTEINVKTVKAKSTLIYLITKPLVGGQRKISREKMADLLWPSMPLSSALQNLRQTLYQIKKSIPDIHSTTSEKALSIITSTRKDLSFNKSYPIEVDANLFLKLSAQATTKEDWEKAILSYNGPFLKDFTIPECPQYDDWIESTRLHIHRKYREGLSIIIKLYLEDNQYAKGEEYARKLTLAEPYHEQGYQYLMSSQSAQGKRNEALKTFHQCVAVLSEELGVSPQASTLELYERIKHTDHPTSSLTDLPALDENSHNYHVIPHDLTNTISQFKHRKIRSFTLITFLILLLVAGLWSQSTYLAFSEEPKDQIRITVLPFDNQSSSYYIADGLTDELISSLTKVPGLTVISSFSSKTYKTTNKSLQEIGKELDVTHILMGKVRETDEETIVSTRLMHIPDQELIWAETFVNKTTELYRIQQKVAEEVSDHLNIALNPVEKEKLALPTHKAEAYEFYLKGRYAFYNSSIDSLNQAERYFKKALEIDPAFNLARCWLAWTYCSFAGSWGDRQIDEVYAITKQTLANIAEEPRYLSIYYKINAWFHLWLLDKSTSEQYFRSAIALNSEEEFALSGLSLVLTLTQKFEEAKDIALVALNHNPHFFFSHFCLATAYYYEGNFSQAEKLLQKTLQLNPYHKSSVSMLARIYLQRQQADKALRLLQTIPDVHPFILGPTTLAHLQKKEIQTAKTLLQQMITLHNQGGKSYAYHIAMIYCQMGQMDLTKLWLQKACARHDHLLNWLAVEHEFKDYPVLDMMMFTHLNQQCGISENGE